MRDALVSVRPMNTHRNSPANRVPAAIAGPSVPSAANSGVPRERAQAQTRSAATAERRPAWSSGGTAALALLIATCWNPQIAHSRTITPIARVSRVRRGMAKARLLLITVSGDAA